jgi:hypothetical protein
MNLKEARQKAGEAIKKFLELHQAANGNTDTTLAGMYGKDAVKRLIRGRAGKTLEQTPVAYFSRIAQALEKLAVIQEEKYNPDRPLSNKEAADLLDDF